MPMKVGNLPFFEGVDEAIHDSFMVNAVSSAQDGLRDRKISATVGDKALGDWEDWRSAGEEIRSHTLNNLDYYLKQLSDNFAARGGHVYFAETAEEARNYIKKVCKEKNAKHVVKAKSMVTEEISLNEALESEGCEVLETDLAEFILQVDHDQPSHIVVPSVHKNRQQIRDAFKKLGYEGSDDPKELAGFARKTLRKKFLEADVGITGCNFAIADSGSICLVTNEGNANMVTAFPETQITVMGMERIVPSWKEMDVVVSLLCRSSVGQKLTTYVTDITPEPDQKAVDSPKDYHLVIVDAGRSNALGTEFQPALHCIRCAACINVCPVYRHIGGHAYGSIYPGPIGAVLSPILGGYEQYGKLPYASSLCAACTEACPVKIPLHKLLIRHRQKYVEGGGHPPVMEKVAMKGFGIGASSPKLFKIGIKSAPIMLKPLVHHGSITKGPGPLKPWTHGRDLPAPSKENFRKWFKNHKHQETTAIQDKGTGESL
ncbi:LutB/LldF family L-lactate oxidation iron-sulfur protein [Sporolactobacillus inulinus]|uniref:Amino acid dehydrogenase n=1 Tax=Sporolactobacillus inulinus CASD TaxID=1069536 RepID=A0A0U1QR22_9BACL|nr:LutB/LldF family L-lactate oxidation iron-sulfur protein [Sporolactobacillus inulinus]KLI03295.1 amino acid dehydrogenase [Sporolactobacillus inulinus CASD]GEB78015.1 lactate utilization protein B [Sporolactobacillus inulinus]